MAAKKSLILWLLLIGGTLIVIETLSYLAITALQNKGIFYKPPSAELYILKKSDYEPDLGWPYATDQRYDSSGSRPVPAFPNAHQGESCVSLYGDSFTWSTEVSDEFTWGNILSKLLGCLVANYGVEGYGTDQSFLRFRKNTKDESPIVFLNHLSENILRNVNQSRSLLYPGNEPGFKPRFIVGSDGALKLIPLPDLSEQEFNSYVSDPSGYLKYEFFLPGGASGIVLGRFPFFYSLVKAFGNYHLRSKLLNQPRYMDFYLRSHPSKALEVTTKILVSFHQKAIERSKTPVISIIPTCDDLIYHASKSIWPYQNLVKMLSLRNISVLNFGVGLANHLDGDDPRTLFSDCSGHYNAAGYELLARIAYRHLEENGIVSSIEN